MKPLLLAGLLIWASPVLAQRVILDFEKGYPEDQFYFLNYNATSAIQLRANSNGHVGKSTSAAWTIRVEEGGLGYTGFGYLHPVARPANPFPDLTPFSHLSLWVNNVSAAAQAARLRFRFELHEAEVETGPDGRRRTQVWVYESDAVLTAPSGWREVLIPLRQAEQLGDGGFAIPPGGFQGNGRLDLDQIKHWAILLLAEGEPVGTRFDGTLLVDYLAAVGQAVDADPGPEPALADRLLPNYPNPFRDATTLAYTVREPAEASLRVFDLLGREVAVLVEPRAHAAGVYEARLDAAGLAAGVYMAALEVGGRRYTQRLVRVR